MKILYLTLFIFAAITLFAQRTITYKVSGETNLSTEKNLPFWQVSNHYGVIPNANNGLLYSGFFSDYTQKHAIDFAYGLSAAGYVSEDKNKIILDEAFMRAKWKVATLNIGCIHPETEYNGISSTNGNLIFSDNARSIPGVHLNVDYFSFPFIKRFIEFKFNWGEYWMNDKRFVKNTLLHTKAVYVKLKPIKSIEFIAGFQHFAQWNGTSRNPQVGKQPDGLKNYLRVIWGKAGGADASFNDRENLLGNHLGRQHYKLNYIHKNFLLSAYIDRPFEDNSGLLLRAFPDALYGFYFGNKKNNNAWVTDFIYEFYYTKRQGGPVHDIPDPDNTQGKDPSDPFYKRFVLGGNDDYFNNSIHQSGWTYYGSTIGSPFFLPYAPNEENITMGIRNNRFVSHYIGIKGCFLKKIPYALRASYSMNYGRYSSPLDNHPRQISLGLESTLPFHKLPFNIHLGVYQDCGDLLPNNFGITLKLTRQGTLLK
ncbi:capsule assembly Wzi family protein [Odoribacter lunatus]|uniref:capsule assembly Wzi family protein n=1 Tax=Odoribacter lunatus TaxID=2941335 RepID=UPI00203C3948|nr:capsule assembly Wzi family protein [Odoribacter lunatus]